VTNSRGPTISRATYKATLAIKYRQRAAIDGQRQPLNYLALWLALQWADLKLRRLKRHHRGG
jgi:hypothetical protein